MSPRWGSIEQSNVFYKNAAPLELKGRTAKQQFNAPRRGDILVDTHVFCIIAQRGDILVDTHVFVLEPQRGEILVDTHAFCI